MLDREEIIKILRKNYNYLVSEYGIKRIGLFGSYAKNMHTQTSDIDIVVDFNYPLGFKFIEFTEYLEYLLGKSVDVLTPAGIESIRIKRVAKSIEESIVYV